MKHGRLLAVLGVAAVVLLVVLLQPRDVAGQGTHTINACTYRTISSVFSTQPVSAPAFAEPFFTETDTVEQSCTLAGTSTFVTPAYPVTPAMVALSPDTYPRYIVDYYREHYPSFFSFVGGGPQRVVYSPWPTASPLGPNDVLTWESVLP